MTKVVTDTQYVLLIMLKLCNIYEFDNVYNFVLRAMPTIF